MMMHRARAAHDEDNASHPTPPRSARPAAIVAALGAHRETTAGSRSRGPRIKPEQLAGEMAAIRLTVKPQSVGRHVSMYAPLEQLALLRRMPRAPSDVAATVPAFWTHDYIGMIDAISRRCETCTLVMGSST